ncbi:MAG: tol-pal system YbgF family protein, partial [Planctomycetota bacterium]
MRRTLALLALLSASSAKDILENGAVGKGDGWNHTLGAASVTFEVDRKEGGKRDGSLSITNTNEDDSDAHNWFTRFEVPPGAPYRLKLSLKRKTEGLGDGAAANVMVQVWPEKGNALEHGWCAPVPATEGWQEIQVVFNVPKEAAGVVIRAYLVGKGKVWYDDFDVAKTDDPATPPPPPVNRPPKDDPMWKIVRSAADGIPWLFDAAEARKRARDEKRPILLYVRCVDDADGYASARTTLRAEKIGSNDDGLKKDVLFRAGPLSDPDVGELIRRRFVPLLLTYHLGVHGVGGGSLPGEEGADPLKEFGLKATEVVTPALAVVDGKALRKLHRIGTMSADLVDWWLRGGLAPSDSADPETQLAEGDVDKAAATGGLVGARALLRRGDLEEAEKALGTLKTPEAGVVRGRIALRRGAWGDALAAFLDAGETTEARFYQAWCMQAVGKQTEAVAEWTAIAGPTPFGRRAAACVLPKGPRLWLAASERLWPRGRTPPQTTEGYAEAFDGVESVRALLELQNADGSFGGHDAAVGEGWNDGAITALASEALELWQARVPEGLHVEAARKRALDYLEGWARRDGGNAFNDAYVLM